MPKFEVYHSQAGDYRWRLKAGNGEIVAMSEGYTTKQSALRSVQNIRSLAPSATIVELN